MVTSHTDKALPKVTPESTDRELAKMVLSKTERVDPNCTGSSTLRDVFRYASCVLVNAI
jgi:hypothetical protein